MGAVLDLQRAVEQGFTRVDQRFDQVDGRLDRVEGRLDRVETRITSVEGEVKGTNRWMAHTDARFEALERRER